MDDNVRTYAIEFDGGIGYDPPEYQVLRVRQTKRYVGQDVPYEDVWEAYMPHQCDAWVIGYDPDPAVVARRLRDLGETLIAAAEDLGRIDQQ